MNFLTNKNKDAGSNPRQKQNDCSCLLNEWKIYLFKFIEKDLFQKETICGQEHQPIVQVNVFKAKLRENFMLYWKTLSHGFLIRDIDLFRAKLSHMCSI